MFIVFSHLPTLYRIFGFFLFCYLVWEDGFSAVHTKRCEPSSILCQKVPQKTRT